MPLTKVQLGMTDTLVSGTAVTASGTSVDFTGLPAGVKRITVMFNGVSTNGTSNIVAQLGTSSGIESTGYVSGLSYAQAGNLTGAINSTAGFLGTNGSAAANTNSGHFFITLVSGNIWVASCLISTSTTYNYFGGGNKTLAGTLDRVRITTVNGTDAFDAGTINILYE